MTTEANPVSSARPAAAPATGGGRIGEMAARIAAHDWSRTPLGRPEDWSPSLRMMVRFLLSNRFPMLLWWGPQYICLYNDAYVPILGTKHPAALGRPTDTVWSEIWDVLRPLIDTPFHGGPSTWDEDIELELRRYGFTEETHFTIAYSPVPDETVPTGIGGVLATVNEITEKVVAERRVTALRDLATRDGQATDARLACELAVQAIGRHPKDVPFAAIYLSDEDGTTASLVASTGLGRAVGWPREVVLDGPVDRSQNGSRSGRDGRDGLPIAEAIRQASVTVVDDLARRLGGAGPPGPWRDPPSEAVLVPLLGGARAQSGVLVAGVSSRLRLDHRYRSFLELVGGQISTAIANARAYEDERRRAEALAELDRAKTAFFSNVSHEFRTPLTLLLGPLRDVLDDGANLRPQQREQLEVADRNARRLLRLVNTLLDFSRIEAGRAEASFEPVDLGAVTADLASQFRAAVERAGLTLDVQVDPIGEPVHVDRDMWEKIVLNLLSNALKSTFEGGIAVRVRRDGRAAVVEVADTGIGITESQLERIFERFHRVEQARSRTHEGSGIGLALVKELVEQHGGEVSVASEVGAGSTFTVRIPIGTAHLPPERIGAERTLEPTTIGAAPFVEEALAWLPSGNGTGDGVAGAADDGYGEAARDLDGGWLENAPAKGARILVVDDNADMLAYIGRLLGRHWTVVSIGDGAAALELLQREAFDLLVCDVMLPGLDGLSLVSRLRADPALSGLPAILVSARAGEESRIDGAAAGVDDYIVKPFSARELVARVAGTLRLAETRRRAREATDEAQTKLLETNQKLQAALAVKDEFLGLVSHELRTPLTAILGMSKVLEKIGSTDPRVREIAADVAASADVLNGLVESMLLLARLDRDEAAVLREPVLLHHAAARILADRGAKDPTRAYRLRAGGPGAVVLVQPTWLERVIDNFVGNAAKYSTPGTPIEVGVEVEGDEARLRVIDQGPGLAEGDEERVFEPFYRAASAKERAAGAGLGLAVAKRIIELMGGRIWARRVDGGSEFGFALPLVRDTEP
ncbi:MAG TPA: ATP-binding protein [Candidatus Binatia bacterium]|nr:ATP-binding protein [Candidatus Binatia bacterium]